MTVGHSILKCASESVRIHDSHTIKLKGELTYICSKFSCLRFLVCFGLVLSKIFFFLHTICCLWFPLPLLLLIPLNHPTNLGILLFGCIVVKIHNVLLMYFPYGGYILLLLLINFGLMLILLDIKWLLQLAS